MDKYYTIYCFEYHDESIDETNAAFNVLTKYMKDQCVREHDVNLSWFSHTLDLKIDDILRYTWDKEDIDIFLTENPECYEFEFWTWINYKSQKYKSIIGIREHKLNKILNK